MIGIVESKDYEMADDEQAPAEEVLKPTTEAEALLDVEVEITIVLGTSMMPIAQVLKLGRGAVIELDRSDKKKYEEILSILNSSKFNLDETLNSISRKSKKRNNNVYNHFFFKEK